MDPTKPHSVAQTRYRILSRRRGTAFCRADAVPHSEPPVAYTTYILSDPRPDPRLFCAKIRASF
jgi:hypothetical protein